MTKCSKYINLIIALVLAWDYATTSANIVFRVKWGKQSGYYTSQTTTTQQQITMKLKRGTYYFVVTAYDTGTKLESVPSNEVKGTF